VRDGVEWVLSLPPGVRYLLAWRHDLCTAVAGVLHRAVHRHLRSWARTRGLGDARSGAVIVVQRFGGALNLNVHFHALVLDGVFARTADGRLRFHRAPAPTAADVADVLAAIVPGVRARLAREGVEEDAAGGDRFADAAPLLAGLAAASVAGTLAVGGVPGRRPERLGAAGGTRAGFGPGAPQARWEGFDLHAGVAVRAGHRARLERVCRYALRPPVPGDRLSVDGDGQVVLQLRQPWADGTTHLRFAPTAFLERLAVLVPRPRVNLVLYFGVLAPHAAWRAEVVPRVAAGEARGTGEEAGAGGACSAGAAGGRWAALMWRAFEVDVLACPRCGGRLRLLALLEAGAVTARILRHLGLATEVPAARPARAPPLMGGDESC
jgi:Putative transposase